MAFVFVRAKDSSAAPGSHAVAVAVVVLGAVVASVTQEGGNGSGFLHNCACAPHPGGRGGRTAGEARPGRLGPEREEDGATAQSEGGKRNFVWEKGI